MFVASNWNRFRKDCDEDEWIEFERNERLFREYIATKPLNVPRSYEHSNADKWVKLISLLTRVFYRDGVFHAPKPNHIQYSVPFLKFVLRILHSYPVDLPDNFHLGADGTYESYTLEIKYTLSFLRDNVYTFFEKKRRNVKT